MLRFVLPVAISLPAIFGVATPASANDPYRHHLQQARHHAAELHRREAQQQAAARAAQRRLLNLSDRANAALAAAQQARAEAETARETLRAQRAALAKARAQAERARQRLSTYASNAYTGQTATGMGNVGTFLTSENPTQVLNDLPLMQQAGASLADIVAKVDATQQAEAAAAANAAAARDAAAKAVTTSRAASQDAHAAVAAQQRVLAQVQQRVLATQRAAAAADAVTAQAKQELRAEIAAARARAAENGGIAKCLGGNVTKYPNGEIPIQMLCPLWGAPGQELRKHAAATFNRMSRAFNHEFGTPICVADSYRTYQRQVELYRERPHYAAQPGTSRHGLGLAVDLCGGIQTDGTAPNVWMRTHAAQFGWFHPSWADQGGGGPYEPWHWEFSG